MITVFFAILPLLTILIFIFVLKQSSIRTGLVASVLTVLLAISSTFHTNINEIPVPIFKSFLTTSIIAYILFFGIFLFHIMEKIGAIDGIAKSLTNATNDRIDQILILTLGFSPLIESVSGFGLAIIVVAPILLALGFKPFQSAMIALVSLCIIPWGTLAMGTIIGSTLGNIPLTQLGVTSALMCIPIYIYLALLVSFLGEERKKVKSRIVEIIYFGFILGISVWCCNQFISVELAGLFGSLIVIFSIFMSINIKSMRRGKRNFGGFKLFYKSMIPYFLLIVLLFLSRTIQPIENWLMSHFVISLPSFEYRLALLHSPGFFLMVISILTIIYYRLNATAIKDSLRQTLSKCFPVIVTTFLYIVVSEVMTTANMIQLLSSTAAQTFGVFYIFLSPFIGATGGFLTGSNTASNTMFSKLQTQTAVQIGASPVLVASAQNVSSSLMTMVNPSRVALSASVCKITTAENELQKRMAMVGMGTLILIIFELIIYLAIIRM